MRSVIIDNKKIKIVKDGDLYLMYWPKDDEGGLFVNYFYHVGPQEELYDMYKQCKRELDK
jgi:hypothetical protein